MDQLNYNSSATKLGPTFQAFNKWCGASWSMPVPIPEMYSNRMHELEKKYSDITWLPLALPKFELGDINEFKEIWERESIEIKPAHEPNAVANFKGMHITSNCLLDFNLHDLYKNGRLTSPQISDENGYHQGRDIVGVYTKKLYKHKFFFNIVSQVMDTFPISEISNMMILETIKDVAPHKEQSWSWTCPTEFRIMLHDENTQPTVYVIDAAGNKSYIDLPDDTNSVCWSNGTHSYGIDYHGKPSYQLVVNAVWNSKKIDALLERSIEKYKRT
jgi:hypothetical protein